MGLLSLALIIDLFLGDPDCIWRRVPHPVVGIGKIIDWFDHFREQPRFAELAKSLGLKELKSALIAWGAGLLLAMLLGAVLIDQIITSLGIVGLVLEVLLVAVLIAQKSLYDHVNRVANALKTEGISAGRMAVSMIVGRDVSELDESGVCKAAVESLAENFSDGVVAPVLWYALAGLPGILFYKAVNTADSMIGHRNEQYEYFGKPAAKLDDWMNWPAARLSSLLVVVAVALARGGKAAKNVWAVTVRDAVLHRSPNAGWPETSFASAMGLSLGGLRQYGDDIIAAEALNPEGRNIAKTTDVEKALALLLRCCFVLIALVLLLWLFFG